jgi:hypothetical protein
VSPSAFAVFKIDDKLELGGPLDGKVGRLGALENLVHVSGCAQEQIGEARAVRQECPGFGEEALEGSRSAAGFAG